MSRGKFDTAKALREFKIGILKIQTASRRTIRFEKLYRLCYSICFHGGGEGLRRLFRDLGSVFVKVDLDFVRQPLVVSNLVKQFVGDAVVFREPKLYSDPNLFFVCLEDVCGYYVKRHVVDIKRVVTAEVRRELCNVVV